MVRALLTHDARRHGHTVADDAPMEIRFYEDVVHDMKMATVAIEIDA